MYINCQASLLIHNCKLCNCLNVVIFIGTIYRFTYKSFQIFTHILLPNRFYTGTFETRNWDLKKNVF